MKSPSLVTEPLEPIPPRFCVLYSVKDVRLIYPKCETEITTSSFAIISSITKSLEEYSISLLLSSPYFSFIAVSSSFTTCIKTFTSESISLQRLINSDNLLCSSSNFSRSKPVNCLKRISTMADA